MPVLCATLAIACAGAQQRPADEANELRELKGQLAAQSAQGILAAAHPAARQLPERRTVCVTHQQHLTGADQHALRPVAARRPHERREREYAVTDPVDRSASEQEHAQSLTTAVRRRVAGGPGPKLTLT